MKATDRPEGRPADRSSESTSPGGRVSANAERFVFVPLRFRREHRDWSNAEHAAWLDLYLASFEVEGRFDSLEVARAYLGSRAGALDQLVAREAFIEVDDAWMLADYLELYDGRRPRHYKTLAERLADADAKQARGEPLLGIERWARWKQRQKSKATETEPEPEEEEERDKERDRANVGQTLANGGPVPLHQDINLYRVFEARVGVPPSFKEQSDIDAMCRKWDRSVVRQAMLDDPAPRNNPDKFIGRLWMRLKEAA